MVNQVSDRRNEGTEDEVRRLVADLIGIAHDQVPTRASFIELGADSLQLMHFARSLTTKFGVKIPFRELLERYPNTELVARRIMVETNEMTVDREQSLSFLSDPEDLPATRDTDTSSRSGSAPFQCAESTAAETDVYAVLRMQLDVMIQQLNVLEGRQ